MIYLYIYNDNIYNDDYDTSALLTEMSKKSRVMRLAPVVTLAVERCSTPGTAGHSTVSPHKTLS